MTLALTAQKREGERAEAVRALRKIPAVLYGAGIAATPISVAYRDFETLYKEAGESTLVDFTIEGSGSPVKVLIQDVQFDPVKGRVLHVDFRQINMSKEMEVDIDLEFIGESLAVKSLGGTLVKALDKIRVKCLPKDLASHITVDISGLNTFDDVIHVKDVSYPPGIAPVEDANSVVAKVLAPLTEEQLKAMEEVSAPVDLSKIEVEEKGKKEEEGEEGADGAKAETGKGEDAKAKKE